MPSSRKAPSGSFGRPANRSTQKETASPPLSCPPSAAAGYGAAPPASRVATAIATRRAYGPPLTPEPLRPLPAQRHGQEQQPCPPDPPRRPAPIKIKSLQTSLYGYRGLPPFIVNHVVLMKSSRIPGPTQPTVVRELVAVGEPSYTALPAGLPHHPRPQRGGSSRAAPVLVDDSMPHPGTRRCCALPQPGHQFPKPGQFRRQSWSRRSLSRAQTLSPNVEPSSLSRGHRT